MESLESKLLVAVPQLPDTNFYQTVVLMLQHDEEGAAGLVLNRPSHVLLADVWRDMKGEEIPTHQSLLFGGPVDGPMMAIHQDAQYADTCIGETLFLATQKSSIEALVESGSTPAKYFTGYAGWGAGQLEEELDYGGWFVTPSNDDYIFGVHEDLWKTVTQDIGERILMSSLTGQDVPIDPSLN